MIGALAALLVIIKAEALASLIALGDKEILKLGGLGESRTGITREEVVRLFKKSGCEGKSDAV